MANVTGVNVLAAMRQRRSVRAYTDEPIAPEVLDRILEAGLLSASGRARRPWELFVVEDRAMLDVLANCRDHGSAMLKEAAAAIVVTADPELSDTWIEDCSIVMANMHLEASASAIGSCWIQGRMRQAADGRSTDEFVREALGYGGNLKLEAILSLGVPAKGSQPRELDESIRAKVHR